MGCSRDTGIPAVAEGTIRQRILKVSSAATAVNQRVGVAEGTIRQRILKVTLLRARGCASSGSRGNDPAEDTERYIRSGTPGAKTLGSRGNDPAEDTESLEKINPITGRIHVAEGTIRQRILKAH